MRTVKNMKQCTKCKISKPLNEYYKCKNNSDGLDCYCKDCKKVMRKDEYSRHKKLYQERAVKYCEDENNKERMYKKHKEWVNDNPERIKGYRLTEGHTLGLTNKQYIKMKRDEKVIQALFFYSDGKMKCELCGNDNIDLLCIDHVNHNGGEHRKTYKGHSLPNQLIKENFPKGYRILCRNCNWLEHLIMYDSVTYYDD